MLLTLVKTTVYTLQKSSGAADMGAASYARRAVIDQTDDEDVRFLGPVSTGQLMTRPAAVASAARLGEATHPGASAVRP
jgi:hypothetical protein